MKMARSKRLINFGKRVVETPKGPNPKVQNVQKATLGREAHEYETPSEWAAEEASEPIDPRYIPLQSTPSVGFPRRTTGYGYDQDTGTLVIEYARGGTYAYDNVPESTWNSLRATKSPGRWIDANIGFKASGRKI
jgi:hypothetical protein